MTENDVESRVRSKLTQVLDPCSCLTDNPVNVIELGLVEDLSVDAGTARIDLLLTSPGCSYYPNIVQDIEEKVGGIPGIEEVEVSQVSNEIWTEDRMARGTRAFRREQMRDRLRAEGLSPYYQST